METKSDNFKDGDDQEINDYYCSSRSGVLDSLEDEEIKRKICCHSLYGLLVQTHLDCLKQVCLGITEIDKIDQKAEEKSSKYKKVISHTMDHQAELNNKFSSLTMDQPAELDNFMEAYCVALSKLKEAMEEPHLESIKFINHMYSQLSELMELPSTTPSTPSNFDGMKADDDK
ncbi:homeobox protein knotted-1-like 6 isoform X1 [Solanum stenotomum]|uniref:homeobox protein knotted-1-like 6 isoform X1 n=1 Tax=Solanum stenotomum TaxID=172797 RepID=UPI0020D0590F|nr:homeobox protein knotted-1-like 6 isoform X1 [Solanum stenotomum]